MTNFLLILILLVLLGVSLARLFTLVFWLAIGTLILLAVGGMLATAMWWFPVTVILGVALARWAVWYGRPTIRNYHDLPPDLTTWARGLPPDHLRPQRGLPTSLPKLQ